MISRRREIKCHGTHTGNGEKEAAFPADSISERSAEDCGYDVEDRDHDCEEGRGHRQHAPEQGDGVHHYGVDAAELLCEHDPDYGYDCGAIEGVADDSDEAYVREGSVLSG